MDGQTIVGEKCERTQELRDINRQQWNERCRVRDVMNNRRALFALVGTFVKDPDMRMPIANLMLRADTVLGQKLGRMPDTKVDPPATSDTDVAHNRADRKARAVTWLDDECALEALLPQVGRWCPGYGFTAAVLRQGWSQSRQPLPMIELRDPIQTFPGEWGTSQQPPDMAVVRVVGRRKLARMYPQHREALLSGAYSRGAGGGVVLDPSASQPGWSNQAGSGVEVYEYYDERGCWWLVPECNLLLAFEPNVVPDDVAFRIVKRYAFDEIAGAYDAVLGPLANMARLALLATIAVEDGVNAETVVIGDLVGDEYKRGRNAVNYLRPGSQVERLNSQVPFQTFTQMDRIERQLRIMAGHDVSEDGISPSSWTTARGIQELQGAGSAEVREYHMTFARWLRSIDAYRLRYMEIAYPSTKFRIDGVHAGAPFAETFTPGKDIKGDYKTRRVYGAMASFDDATKIITGLQLKQGGILDSDTIRENIDGLENHQRIKERIRAEQAEKVAFDTLLSLAGQGDPKAMQAAIQIMPAGEMRSVLEAVFAPAEEPAPPEAAPPAAPGEPVPDVMTVLSRLNANGQSTGGAQIVSRVA